jgi:hypothetical protein
MSCGQGREEGADEGAEEEDNKCKYLFTLLGLPEEDQANEMVIE